MRNTQFQEAGDGFKLLPKMWIGYFLAAIFLVAEIGGVKVDSEVSGNTLIVLFAIYTCGWFYWLYCVYRMHKVIADATNSLHPVSPRKAVGYSLIPLYNFYWLFKWTNEIANFVNQRLSGPPMAKGWTGFFLLLGILLGNYVDFAIGLAVIFTVGEYLTNKVGNAIDYVRIVPDTERGKRWNVAFAGGLGAGFGFMLYNAVIHYKGDSSLIVSSAIMLMISGRFLDPIIERLQTTLGFQTDHPIAQAGQSRPVWITVVFVFFGLLHHMTLSILDKMIDEKGYIIVVIMIVVPLLMAGVITYCWQWGAWMRPPQAAKLGALSGVIAGVFMSLVWLQGTGVKNSPLDVSTVMQASAIGLVWPIVGLTGGLAINPRWGFTSSQWVMVTMAVTVLLLDIPRVLFHLPPFMEGLMMDFLIVFGWGLGLVLHPSANVMFDVSRRKEERGRNKGILYIDTEKLQELEKSAGIFQLRTGPLSGNGTQTNQSAAPYPRDKILEEWDYLRQILHEALLTQGLRLPPRFDIRESVDCLVRANLVEKALAELIVLLYEEGEKIADSPFKKVHREQAIVYRQLLRSVSDWLNRNVIIVKKPIPTPVRRTQVGSYFQPSVSGQLAVLLVGISGPVQGQRSTVDKALFRIGANPDNDLVIADDSYVSGNHAYLRFDKGVLMITDQHSRNGTFVNDNRIMDTPVPVNLGDQIRLGASTFEIVQGPRLV